MRHMLRLLTLVGPMKRARPTLALRGRLQVVLGLDRAGATGPVGRMRFARWSLVWAGIGLLVGCRGFTDLGGTSGLPAGVPDPATVRTPAGALAMARAAVADFQWVVPGYVATAGLLTDELQDQDYGESPILQPSGTATFDARLIPEGPASFNDPVYGGLQGVRREVVQALGALAKYDSGAHPALMGEAYALEGYAEVLLADLFCSGVPLSTIQFEGDFVYQPGSTTQEVYRHAVTLFDSALARAGDSTRILNLARVGKGRALLNLGDYAGAAASVAAVPDTFHYQFPVLWNATLGDIGSKLNTFLSQEMSVADREGGTGQPYRSSGDPRTQVVGRGTNAVGQPLYFPAKYGQPGSTTPVVLASGVEARLIQAEAALQANPGDGQWLTLLNALRTSCLDAGSCPTPAPAGTGSVAGLPLLADPGSADARLDTLFAERAAWLFVTGTRQGDLRRLVRLYGRLPDEVYPSGVYPGRGGLYGTDVTAPIPTNERYNPLFTGCFNRGA